MTIARAAAGWGGLGGRGKEWNDAGVGGGVGGGGEV